MLPIRFVPWNRGQYRQFCRTLIILLLLLPLVTVQAFDVPPSTGVNVAIQTNGPNTPLTSGDFYTNVGGGNGLHELNIIVPCTWTAGVPVTFSVYDPESRPTNVANPVPYPILDQIRPNDSSPANRDNTTFTLIAPGGAVVANPTFAWNSGSHGRYVELATINPAVTGCGTYRLTSSVANDDENGWRLRVAHDPDCTLSPGTCSGIGPAQHTLLDDGDHTDDSDGVAGSGDELVAGSLRISYEPTANGCQTFFFFVDGLTTPITLHNFDMDAGAGVTITYRRPNGTTIAGTASGDSRWNGGVPGSPAARVGDSIAVTQADAGWWQAELCTNIPNQYIFEGLTGQLVFLQQPLTPNITLGKSDGGATVSTAGGNVTYTLTYSNTGNGAATNVTITDTLPAGATFVSCTGGCTGTGPVNWNLGLVAAGATGNVTLTVALPASAAGTNFTNNASAAYQDTLGNTFPPATAQDITPSAAPAGAPNMTLTKSDGVATIGTAGATVTYTLAYSNTGTADATNVTITDNLPTGATFVSCTRGCTGTGPVNWNIGTVTAGNGDNVTLTVTLPASPAGTVFTNSATLNYQDAGGTAQPAVNATDVTNVAGGGTPPVPPAGNPDPNPANPAPVGQVASASAVNPLLAIVDPFITKSVNPPFAIPGEAVTWTITISNPGTIPVNNVTMQDTLPSEVQILSVVATSGNTTSSGQRVSFSQATLNPGESVTITINTRVRDNVAMPFTLRNQACFSSATTAQQCATSPNVLSVATLPSTGLSPWSAYRLPLITLTGVISLLAGMIGLRRSWLK